MTIKVTFRKVGSGEVWQMMFGDSYKKWQEQYEEYRRMINMTRDDVKEAIKFEKSKQEWIGYGGLKWCSIEDFQGELDYAWEHDKTFTGARKLEDIHFVEFNPRVVY